MSAIKLPPAYFLDCVIFKEGMAAWSPTLEGFRTLFRRPAVALAEIAWRWSFGAAAWVLVGLCILEYLDTLPVSNFDRVLLRSHNPTLVFEALAHIFHGSIPRLVLASVVMFSALVLLWILVASFVRGVTLEAVVEYIRQRAADAQAGLPGAGGTTLPVPSSVAVAGGDATSGVWHQRSLTGLHFLRAGAALSAGASGLGGLILASFASSKTEPHPGLVAFLALAILSLVWLVWSSLCWFLSLASIFVVRQGKDTFAAVAAAVDLTRDRVGPVMAVGTWFGLAHLVLFIVASSAVTFPLAFAQILPIGYVLIAVLLLTLAYFAIVDSLYIGRLAGYVAILEAPALPRTAPVAGGWTSGVPSSQQSTPSVPCENPTVDQDELILSDQPLAERNQLSSDNSRVDQDETILSDVALRREMKH